MHQEMKYGLSVDVVFDRFAKRMNLEEAEYLSSSLTILNRTGGNIVAVFNSIEKTLFDKKKLNEELIYEKADLETRQHVEPGTRSYGIGGR